MVTAQRPSRGGPLASVKVPSTVPGLIALGAGLACWSSRWPTSCNRRRRPRGRRRPAAAATLMSPQGACTVLATGGGRRCTRRPPRPRRRRGQRAKDGDMCRWARRLLAWFPAALWFGWGMAWACPFWSTRLRCRDAALVHGTGSSRNVRASMCDGRHPKVPAQVESSAVGAQAPKCLRGWQAPVRGSSRAGGRGWPPRCG